MKNMLDGNLKSLIDITKTEMDRCYLFARCSRQMFHNMEDVYALMRLLQRDRVLADNNLFIERVKYRETPIITSITLRNTEYTWNYDHGLFNYYMKEVLEFPLAFEYDSMRINFTIPKGILLHDSAAPERYIDQDLFGLRPRGIENNIIIRV